MEGTTWITTNTPPSLALTGVEASSSAFGPLFVESQQSSFRLLSHLPSTSLPLQGACCTRVPSQSSHGGDSSHERETLAKARAFEAANSSVCGTKDAREVPELSRFRGFGRTKIKVLAAAVAAVDA
ncbi:hypothetical protein Q7P36_008849 [Cladosporium allicinum]